MLTWLYKRRTCTCSIRSFSTEMCKLQNRVLFSTTNTRLKYCTIQYSKVRQFGHSQLVCFEKKIINTIHRAVGHAYMYMRDREK